MELSEGLEPGNRFRCTTCGNLTRFDVTLSERTRAFHHFTIGGERTVEDVDVLARTIEQVSCRWCNNATVVAEVAPASDEADA